MRTPYTTNLCQKCYHESLKARGDEPLTRWQWHEFVERKSASWKTLESDGRRTIRARDVGIFSFTKRATVKRFREEAEEERQAGIQGQWQLESPAREYLEQV